MASICAGAFIAPPPTCTKSLVVESDFDLERIDEYPVRGFNDPIELFAYHG